MTILMSSCGAGSSELPPPATSALEMHLADRALLLSQAGPRSPVLTARPTSAEFTIRSAQFRVLLLRRTRMPFTLAPRTLPLERAMARVCREAGARVCQHVRLSELEVVAHGLPVWHGAQLASDATIVSPVAQASACPMLLFGGCRR